MPKNKNFFNNVWNEFIYGGHLFSLGITSFILVSSFLLGITATIDSLLIIYLGGQIIYLYNRYKESKIDFLTNSKRSLYIQKYGNILPLMIFIFIIIVVSILIYLQKFLALWFAIFIIFLGLAYSHFFKKITKKVIGFKNFFVSFFGTLLLLFIIIYYNYHLTVSFIFLSIFVFLRFFIHESFSDIKDIESDKKGNLLTFPIVLGKEKLIKILCIINLLTIVPIVSGIYWEFLPISASFLLFSVPYSMYYFKNVDTDKFNKSFFYNVLVDGEFILISLFFYFVKSYYV